MNAPVQIDDYAAWRAALAKQSTDAFEKRPHCGFWRKGRSGDPVAVWRAEDGSLVAKIGSRAPQIADAEFDEMSFGFCLPNPISHETYTAVMRGEPWPGTDEVVASQIGHNSGAVDDVEALRDQIEAAVAQAKGYGAVADDETDAKAQSLRSRLLELSGVADKRHAEEKAPHLEAGRAVDARWLPLKRTADEAAKAIRQAMTDYANVKLAARRKKEAEEAEAERKRREAELAAMDPVERQAAPEPPAPAKAPEKPTQVRGGYGRAASVGTYKAAVIVDQDAFYMAMRTNPDVVAILQKLAQRIIAAGGTSPGIKAEEKARVR
ncbi:hypothetical protein SAMN05519103_00311 [Rhizobiales bacterium GAS113]|nr:hypothetical protein SAMN05519103_00311 [Rhizobiales bacterium GAS113]